jgi:hypothetical protein
LHAHRDVVTTEQIKKLVYSDLEGIQANESVYDTETRKDAAKFREAWEKREQLKRGEKRSVKGRGLIESFPAMIFEHEQCLLAEIAEAERDRFHRSTPLV